MRVLYIPPSRIGDAVLSTPPLRYLENLPEKASVTIAADPLSAPLFEDYPFLDELIVLAKEKFHRHWMSLWKKTVSQKWDWVIDCRGSFVSYGLRAKKRSIWNTSYAKGQHKTLQICSFCQIPPTQTKIWVSLERQNAVKKWLPDDRPTLALGPTANWIGKQWPLENFQEVVQRFLSFAPEANLLVLAAPHERGQLEQWISSLPPQRVFFPLLPHLLDVSAALAQSALFLGHDSGLMHLSGAVGTPAIALFGPSRDEIYGPLGAEHRILRTPESFEHWSAQPNAFSQKSHSYMNSLPTKLVWNALKEKWREIKSSL